MDEFAKLRRLVQHSSAKQLHYLTLLTISKPFDPQDARGNSQNNLGWLCQLSIEAKVIAILC